MPTAIAAAAEIGDTDSDSALAFVAIAAEAASTPITEVDYAIAAAAETGNPHTDSAAPFPSFAAETASTAIAEVDIAIAAAAETGNPHTNSAAALTAFVAETSGAARVSVTPGRRRRMMVPGSIDGSNNWIESTSLARAIEDAMVVAGVINVGKEAKANTKDRRKSFVAIANGLINYLQQNMVLQFAQGALRAAAAVSQEVPPAATTISQAVK